MFSLYLDLSPYSPMSLSRSPYLDILTLSLFQQRGHPVMEIPTHSSSLFSIKSLSQYCLSFNIHVQIYIITLSELNDLGAIILCLCLCQVVSVAARNKDWKWKLWDVETEEETDISEYRENNFNDLISYFLTLTWVYGRGEVQVFLKMFVCFYIKFYFLLSSLSWNSQILINSPLTSFFERSVSPFSAFCYIQ